MELFRTITANAGLFFRATASLIISLPLLLKFAYVLGQMRVLKKIEEMRNKNET